MVDLDDNYALNARIQSRCFKDETLPGSNTMSATELEANKDAIDEIINRVNHWTTNYALHANDKFFENTFIKLFKKLMKDEDYELTEKEENYLIQTYGSAALIMQRADDYDEPTSV
jgi:hypothetical protein